MTLQVPNLDDRTYDELATEARGLIPKNFPLWTDHNTSDPGITLLELFAFLLESSIYHINRVPERSLEHFAELAGTTRGQGEPIEQTIRRALDLLEEKNRAITSTDFESQIMTEFLQTKYVLACQPVLKHNHPVNVKAILMETSPDITTLDQNAVADPTHARGELILASPGNLAGDDIVMIDDGVNTEFMKLVSVPPSSGSVTVTTDSPLRFNHERGARIKKVISPIKEAGAILETTLIASARDGDSIVILKPLEKMNRAGVLQIDTGTSTEYVRAQGVSRTRTLIEVTAKPNVFPKEQFIKVIIVPNESNTPEPTPTADLRQAVFRFLRLRGLITTRIKVVSPEYTPLDIETTVVRNVSSRLNRNTVQKNVEKAIQDFLSPLIGGTDGNGWEFGRSVYRSELYQRIENTPGVDHVEQLLMGGDDAIGEKELLSHISLVKLIKNEVKVVDN